MSRNGIFHLSVSVYNSEYCVCSSLSTTLNTVSALYICGNRKLLPLSYSYRNLQFGTALLLLLAGGVNVNPARTHNFRIATINARSMREKAPALSDLVHCKSIDILSVTVTETWLTKRETRAGFKWIYCLPCPQN